MGGWVVGGRVGGWIGGWLAEWVGRKQEGRGGEKEREEWLGGWVSQSPPNTARNDPSPLCVTLQLGKPRFGESRYTCSETLLLAWNQSTKQMYHQPHQLWPVSQIRRPRLRGHGAQRGQSCRAWGTVQVPPWPHSLRLRETSCPPALRPPWGGHGDWATVHPARGLPLSLRGRACPPEEVRRQEYASSAQVPPADRGAEQEWAPRPRPPSRGPPRGCQREEDPRVPQAPPRPLPEDRRAQMW